MTRALTASNKVFCLRSFRSKEALTSSSYVPDDVLVFSYILGFVAYMTGYFVGSIYYTVNDFHIYANHLDPVNKYFKQYMGWRLMFKRVAGYFSYDFTQYNGDNPDIDDTLQTITDLNFDIVYNFDKYISNPFIKAEVTV